MMRLLLKTIEKVDNICKGIYCLNKVIAELNRREVVCTSVLVIFWIAGTIIHLHV